MKDNFTNLMLSASIISVFIAGALGSFGAVVQYLYLVVSGKHRYQIRDLLIYMLMGLFIGMVADQFMREILNQSYPGIILVSGLLSLQIIDFLNQNGLGILVKRVGLDKKE